MSGDSTCQGVWRLFTIEGVVGSEFAKTMLHHAMGRLLGVLASSDHDRSKGLYALPLDVFVDVFASVGNEKVTAIGLRLDERGERVWKVLESHGLRAPDTR